MYCKLQKCSTLKYIRVLYKLLVYILGTAKHMIKIWKEKGYLNKQNLKTIQDVVDSSELPADVGKLPGTIDNFTFDGFTADELKNFYLLFSIYCLHDILPNRDLECLRKFVIACTYICNRVITTQDIKICDNYLIQFCKDVEILYGSQAVTPNMHLHGHLAECMLDYGPIYSFWLFSFERYNGLLGSIPTNKKGIEIQFMNRFVRESVLITKELPSTHKEVFSLLLNSVNSANADRGALNDMISLDFVPFLKFSSRFTDYSINDWALKDSNTVSVPGSKRMYTMTEAEHKNLTSCYQKMYPGLDTKDNFIPISCWKSKLVRVYKEMYGSQGSRSHRSSYVTAYWCGKDGFIESYNTMYFFARPGRIRYFISHLLYVDGVAQEHVFAVIEWFLPMGDEKRYKYGKPVEVWSSDLFEFDGEAMFMPVQRIKSKFMHIKFLQ